jgi:hypothetical protein
LEELKLEDRGNVETHAPGAARTLQSVLSQPFEPLTLRHAMKLFPTALALTPGTPGLPSDDFLANFLSGHRTHLAMVRQGFGKDFKNFQNYALRRVETTPAVRQRLIQALEGNEQLLEILADSMRVGVQASQLAQLTRAGEGALYQVMRTLSSGSLKCVHCKAELVSRPAQWWGKQSCVLGEPEYRFVDRILYDLLAVILLPLAFQTNWSQKEHAVSRFASLCDPGTHPFKHWLDLVRGAYRAKDLTALAARAGLAGPSPDSHLQRCSRGEMLTAETIGELTKRLPQPKPLRDLGMQTRALAFAIDFLVAADGGPDSLGWEASQAIVKARILQLSSDLRLSFATGDRQAPASDEARA